jgi:hypothetical protein
MANLGFLAEDDGDLKAAKRWFKKAADLGDDAGRLGLSALLERERYYQLERRPQALLVCRSDRYHIPCTRSPVAGHVLQRPGCLPGEHPAGRLRSRVLRS